MANPDPGPPSSPAEAGAAPHAPQPSEPQAAAADSCGETTSRWAALNYGLSLPERALRGAAAVAAGAVRESCQLLVPRLVQDSRTWSTVVRQTLDFAAEGIGGVRRSTGVEPAAPAVDNFAARKAVGNLVDMAGLATLHLSPLLVLAVVSDVAYGSRVYLHELTADLRRQGVLGEAQAVDDVDQLLAALGEAAGKASAALDTPPLSLDELRRTVGEVRAAAGGLDPTRLVSRQEVDRLWTELHSLAAAVGVSPWQLASTATLATLSRLGVAGQGALSGVRVAGSLAEQHLFQHYAAAFRQIRDDGYYATLSRTSAPYLDALWHNFAAERATVTEDLLSGKLWARSWNEVQRMLGRNAARSEPPAAPN